MGLSRAERTRRLYRPEHVRVLFIGESPPAGGTFFYDANSKLYRVTREAFEAALPALRRNPDFLKAFQQLGCYLEDLAIVSVNGLPDDERQQACVQGVGPLARRIKPYRPLAVALVIKRIERPAREALKRAGLGDLPLQRLPFPGRRAHELAYKAELTDLVRSWSRRQVFHPLEAGTGSRSQS
jgi:hypothetical protein